MARGISAAIADRIILCNDIYGMVMSRHRWANSGCDFGDEREIMILTAAPECAPDRTDRLFDQSGCTRENCTDSVFDVPAK